MTFSKKIILIILGAFFFVGCKKDDPEPSLLDQSLDQLASTWRLTTVTANGLAASGDYSGFELILTGSSKNSSYAYVVKGRPNNSPWPSGGTWNFGTEVDRQIVRDPGTGDELAMTYQVIGSQLTLQFVFQGQGYSAGRVNTIDGNWSFVFTKK